MILAYAKYVQKSKKHFFARVKAAFQPHVYNKQITKILFILDNQRWRLKDDDTLENVEGILDGAPTWNMPDTKWAFIHSAKDEEKFLIRNTKLKKYLHVEEMKKGELVNADAEEGKTLFKKINEDDQGYFSLVLAKKTNLALTVSSPNTLTLEGK